MGLPIDRFICAENENDTFVNYLHYGNYNPKPSKLTFSNAMDVAKMMQLYLQKGNYGGYHYFSEKTFNDFNTCYFCAEGNRRGLGLDKPQLPNEKGPTCGCVAMSSFGHTGFTGTMAWADPETETIFVFLSNRTFPDSNAPNLLSKGNVREDIQKVIQEAIIK
jgi:CubicO group peptidase (beta-lactamase class C family)